MRYKQMLIACILCGLTSWAFAQFTVSVLESSAIEESVLIDGSNPSIVITENPSTPAIAQNESYSGGIDKGSPGDNKAFILASPRDKRWKGGTVNPQSISLFFSLAPDTKECEIELGYFEGTSQTRQFDLYLNGVRIHSFRLPQGTYGSQEKKLKEILLGIEFPSTANSQGPHTLRITQTDWWGTTLIDAIIIRGKGIRLLNPETKKPFDTKESSALPPNTFPKSLHYFYCEQDLFTMPIHHINHRQKSNMPYPIRT
ncbi:MAG: hypothetical protein WDA18_04465 [Candidatus Ratteibacteria bacterium]|jgi:hypothetical protein